MTKDEIEARRKAILAEQAVKFKAREQLRSRVIALGYVRPVLKERIEAQIWDITKECEQLTAEFRQLTNQLRRLQG